MCSERDTVVYVCIRACVSVSVFAIGVFLCKNWLCVCLYLCMEAVGQQT